MNCTAVTVKGKINDRKDKDKPRREILINEKSQLAKLPMADYPVTHMTEPKGLAATLISGEHKCEASFHRYPEGSRLGEHAYIGSATKRLRDVDQASLFEEFLKKGRIFTPETEVRLDFKKCSQGMMVYISQQGMTQRQDVARKTLKNKPLIEAIFELRWGLKEQGPGIRIDPHYKILIGRMYERLRQEYPFHEQLPTASIPDEVAAYVVQHRFRKNRDEWPLIQIGPGIITLNATEGYIWEDFKNRAVQAANALFEAYPEAEDSLKPSTVLLRYIDAIEFDFETGDIFDFLRANMKTIINLYPKLFESTGIERLPRGFDWRFSFRSTTPAGVVHLRFCRGKKKQADALVWESMVQSTSDEVSDIQTAITEWLDRAHDVTDDWFFKLVEGELLRRFE